MPNCHVLSASRFLSQLPETKGKKFVRNLLLALAMTGATTAPAFCQGFSFTGSVNLPTPPGVPGLPMPPIPPLPPIPGIPGVTISTSNGGSNLPPTNLDSFVYQAGAQAEYIYGDEGVNTKPQMSGFTTACRINSGILGVNDAGLTTGHGSYMPDATGNDEFVQGGEEWGMSGAGSGGSGMFNAPMMGGDGDNTQTKELANSAAGNMGSGLLTVPINGDLSQVWNPPPPPTSNSNFGMPGAAGGSGGSISIGGVSINFGSGGVSASFPIPGL
jgi:hypothetical protein